MKRTGWSPYPALACAVDAHLASTNQTVSFCTDRASVSTFSHTTWLNVYTGQNPWGDE